MQLGQGGRGRAQRSEHGHVTITRRATLRSLVVEPPCQPRHRDRWREGCVRPGAPFERFAGHDGQLESAVKHLTAKIGRRPVDVPKVPNYRRRSRGRYGLMTGARAQHEHAIFVTGKLPPRVCIHPLAVRLACGFPSMRAVRLVPVVGMLLSATASAQIRATSQATALYRSVAPAVFLLEVRDDEGRRLGVGSAFLIEGNRLVTNAHVVTGGTPYLRTGAVVLPLTVQQLDVLTDIAVVSLEAQLDASPLAFAATEPGIGSSIFAIGNPQGLERTISQGLISGRRDFEGRDLLQITAAISPGSSGGPVVDSEGKVIGVTVGQLSAGQNLNFAIPVSALQRLLAGASANTFATALARPVNLIEQEPPPYTDKPAWAQYWERIRAALDEAAAAASSGDQHLALAALAAASFENDRTTRFAERALRDRTTNPDSARILLIESWEWDLIVKRDTAPPALLRRYLAVADTILRNRPRRAATHIFRGRVLAAIPGRRAEALPAARRAIDTARQTDDDPTPHWSALHSLAHEVGSPADDDMAFRGMVQAGSARPFDWRSHAQHLNGRQEWRLAAQAFRQAFNSSARNNANDICDAGGAFWKGELNDEALTTFRQCVSSYALAELVDTSRLAYAHRGLASILQSRGVYSTAESHARQALSLAPTDEWAALALADALLGLERNSESAVAAEQAIRLSDGRYSSMHFTAGSAYFALQDWSRCERAFRRADELAQQTTTNAAYNAALCLARQGYYRDAAQWMEKVLQREPRRGDRADIEGMIRRWRGGQIR